MFDAPTVQHRYRTIDLADCGVTELHIQLARLGFSLSCDEIKRFKQSLLQNDQQVEAANQVLASTPVAHYVADNVDHNVRTLDGLNTFHGMGIIMASVQKHGEFGKSQRVVCRLKTPLKAADAIRYKCVPILSSNVVHGKGLADVELPAIRTLRRQLQLPAILNLTTVWHAAGKISPDGRPRPNWAEYMQTACDGEHSAVGTVEMLSTVDLNPSDNDCMYSTL
jgi:hypothetical protein